MWDQHHALTWNRARRQERVRLEHTRSRALTRKQDKKGVSRLCHKTMNKLDRSDRILTCVCVCCCKYTYTGAGHIIRISSKSWFISQIAFKKWNLYNVYIHSTQTDIFQVFISFNFDDYKWQLMKTPNSVSQKIRILWKGSILKTPGATL